MGGGGGGARFLHALAEWAFDHESPMGRGRVPMRGTGGGGLGEFAKTNPRLWEGMLQIHLLRRFLFFVFSRHVHNLGLDTVLPWRVCGSGTIGDEYFAVPLSPLPPLRELVSEPPPPVALIILRDDLALISTSKSYFSVVRLSLACV